MDIPKDWDRESRVQESDKTISNQQADQAYSSRQSSASLWRNRKGMAFNIFVLSKWLSKQASK